MSKLSHLAGMSLLALSVSWPALAEGPRPIKIGVLSRPEAFRPVDEGGCFLVAQSKKNLTDGSRRNQTGT